MNKIVTLPNWLDNIIYNEFGAIYELRPIDVEYNPEQNYDFAKIYLGTYFPRSFAEAYCIMGQLLENQSYFDALVEETELNVLDLCCGMGGEIFGLISILQNKLPNLKHIKIDAFDANPDYIQYLFQLSIRLNDIADITVDVDIIPQSLFIETEQNLLDITHTVNTNYNVILCFKALNEFIQSNTFPNENIYHKVAGVFLPLLLDNGIMILSDLSHKNNQYGFFYPVEMNKGINLLSRGNNVYKSIYPYSCHFYEQQCPACYMQDIMYVTHSRKNRDISKIAYRIIGRTEFANRIAINRQPNRCKYINPQADKSVPYQL